MGKAFISQINFNNYQGAKTINIYKEKPVLYYLEDISATDSDDNVFLSYDDQGHYNITINSDNEIYLNSDLAGICSHLTLLSKTDLINKSKANYKYVTNMHTAFLNCYNLEGTPATGKNVYSMYGTYYNCGLLTDKANVGEKTNNLIGTYYNCNNITELPSSGSNVKVLIDTFYNCTHLTGSPFDVDEAISLQNAYYNCYLINGNPANCNSAIITTNAYYNCSNLYGDFYWCLNNFSQADRVNAVNMFYHRNCEKPLNIYVKKNSGILNCLQNYSATFGDIYGLGEITWTPLVNTEGNLYYNNTLYNTNLYLLENKIVLPNMRFGYNDDSSEISSHQDETYMLGNFISITLNYDTLQQDRPNANVNIYYLMDIYNSKVQIPSDYTQAIIPESSNSANLFYYFNLYVKYENVTERMRGSRTTNLDICQKYGILQVNKDYKNYELYEHYLPSYLFQSSEPDYDADWGDDGVLLYSAYKNGQDPLTVNIFNLITKLNNSEMTSMDNLLRRCRFQNNTIIDFVIPNTVIDMDYFCYTNNYYIDDLYYYYPSNYPQGYPNGYPPFPYISWLPCGKYDNIEWISKIQKYINQSYNMGARYSSNNEKINIFIKTSCGDNVINMSYAYRGCRLYKNKINIGNNVVRVSHAFDNTDCTGDTIYMKDNVRDASDCFRNCHHIYNLKNFNFTNKYCNYGAIFMDCSNLIELNNAKLQSLIENFYYGFYNCHNLVHSLNADEIIDHPTRYPIVSGSPRIFFSQMYYNCSNLRFGQLYKYTVDTNFHRIEYDNMYYNCINLHDCLYLNNFEIARNNVSLNFEDTFYNCKNLICDEINIRGNIFYFNSAFYNCENITNASFYIYGNNFWERFNNCFINCYNLTNVNFDSTYTNIVYQFDNTFVNCYNLKNCYFNQLVKGNVNCHYTFINCYNLQNISLPNAIIGYSSFVNCYNLESVNLAGKEVSIQQDSFINVPNLSNINLIYGSYTGDLYHSYTMMQSYNADNLNIYCKGAVSDLFIILTNNNHCGVNNLYIETPNLILSYINTDDYTPQITELNTNLIINTSIIKSQLFNKSLSWYQDHQSLYLNIIKNDFNYFNFFSDSVTFQHLDGTSNFHYYSTADLSLPTFDQGLFYGLSNIRDFIDGSGCFNFRDLDFKKYISSTPPEDVNITVYLNFLSSYAYNDNMTPISTTYVNQIANYLKSSDYTNFANILLHCETVTNISYNTLATYFDTFKLYYKNLFGIDTTNISFSVAKTIYSGYTYDADVFYYAQDPSIWGSPNLLSADRFSGQIFYPLLRLGLPVFGEPLVWDNITYTNGRRNAQLSYYNVLYKNEARNIRFKVNIITDDRYYGTQQIIDFIMLR